MNIDQMPSYEENEGGDDDFWYSNPQDSKNTINS